MPAVMESSQLCLPKHTTQLLQQGGSIDQSTIMMNGTCTNKPHPGTGIVAACRASEVEKADAVKKYLRKLGTEESFESTIEARGALEHICQVQCQSKLELKTEPLATLENFLKPCRQTTAVMNKYLDRQPLDGHVIVLLHHLTREVLGTIEALRQLGCRDIVCQFSGYNPTATEVYGPELAKIPPEELSAYKLTAEVVNGKTIYKLDQQCLQRPQKETFASSATALDAAFLRAETYTNCARALASFITLEALGRCVAAGKKLMIIEDGGYIVPLINHAALSDGVSVAGYRAEHFVPADDTTDVNLGGSDALMKNVVESYMVGSAEHTRNGYDKVQNVKLTHGKLAKPCVTIAISYAKTQIESLEVAATCLNSITSTMYSRGQILWQRKACVLGSRGNIGGRATKMLVDRLRNGTDSVTGVDIKVNRTSEEPMPSWQPSGLKPAVPGLRETSRFRDLPDDVRREIDFVFGITGGASESADGTRYETLVEADVDFWLEHGVRPELWLASGSTKTKEFVEVQSFVEELVQNGVHTVGGVKYSVMSEDLVDPLTSRDYGQVFRFTPEKGSVKELLVIGDWKPVNFMFYGVPTEMIDVILAQLVDISASLALNPYSHAVHAVDFNTDATNGIVASFADLKEDLPLVAPGQPGW